MVWHPGQKLQGGRYIIERHLGKGGFGIAYLAWNKCNQKKGKRSHSLFVPVFKPILPAR
ncbi:hypothetical protein [Coleofasciculus sp. FACHB-501]|uniref:hypothetical protein n=1 Tax=Coleofasciculus sp. FACHB-501 TaxID=2692786 RepID=UPI0016841960|nr:hypothetical protein [Coleofasciculus sp. FACHB-501]